MAEFKKLSAVEAVNEVADTANVLIEEDGVIKRAPKSEVGGVKVASTAEVGQTIVVKAVDESGNPTEWECADLGKKPDLVISVNLLDIDTPTVTADNFTIVEGNISDVCNIIRAGNPAVAKIRYSYPDDEWVAVGNELPAFVNIYGEELYISYMSFNCYGEPYRCFLALSLDGAFDRFATNKITYS